MSKIHHAVPESALRLDFTARIQDEVTHAQLKMLTRNASGEGVLDYLDNMATWREFDQLGANLEGANVIDALGPDARAKPWDALMHVMDGIQSAEAELDAAGIPGQTKVNVRFGTSDKRERFHHLTELLLAGIHGPTMPHMRTDGARGLTLEGMLYADICTPGRVGSALFRQQYLPALGPGLRLLLQKNIEQIKTSKILNYAPEELKTRATNQRKVIGKRAGETLLTSGNLSLIGMTMRDALEEAGHPLKVQRPHGNRPAIEQRLDFYARRSSSAVGLPVSGTTVTRQVGGQLRDRAASIRDGDIGHTAETLASLLMGLGFTEGIFSALRASATISAATARAVASALQDARTRRQLQRLEQ